MPGFANPSLTSLNGLNRALVGSAGGLQISLPGSTLLSDNFDGTTIDTTYRWQSPVLAVGGTVTQNASLILTTGTTASNAATLTSIETFAPTGPGFSIFGCYATPTLLPTTNFSLVIGCHSAGAGGGVVAATPVTDGAVFEWDIAGTWGCSIYSTGVRIARVTTKTDNFGNALFPAQGLQMPAAGIPMLLVISERPDATFFYINNVEEAVVTIPIASPAIVNLPARFAAINHTAGPANAQTWSFISFAVLDSAQGYQTGFTGQTVTRLRSPAVFKNINAVASGTTLWTPASGRKFRLMGYNLMTTTAAGVVTLTDSGNAAVIPGGIIPVGITSPTVSPPQGNGYLGAAVNGTITQAFTGGGALSGYLFGTEE